MVLVVLQQVSVDGGVPIAAMALLGNSSDRQMAEVERVTESNEDS